MTLVLQESVSREQSALLLATNEIAAMAWIAADLPHTTLLLTSEGSQGGRSCNWKRIERNQGDKRAHSLRAKP